MVTQVPLGFSEDIPEEGTWRFSCFKKEAASRETKHLPQSLEIFTLKIGDYIRLFQPGKGKETLSSGRKE